MRIIRRSAPPFFADGVLSGPEDVREKQRSEYFIPPLRRRVWMLLSCRMCYRHPEPGIWFGNSGSVHIYIYFFFLPSLHPSACAPTLPVFLLPPIQTASTLKRSLSGARRSALLTSLTLPLISARASPASAASYALVYGRGPAVAADPHSSRCVSFLTPSTSPSLLSSRTVKGSLSS